MSAFDVAIVGSSPNALAAAARLAAGGQRVVLLDTAASAGGPVTTEEFAPGFFANTGVMSCALDPEIAQALSLELSVIRRSTVTALGPRPYTLRALPALPEAVAQAVALLRAAYRVAPPSVPPAEGADGALLFDLGRQLLGLGERPMHEVLRLLFLSARDFFEEQALPEPVQGLLAGASLRALSEGPFAPGTLFGFLHHQAVDDGLFRCTAEGGLVALPRALEAAARRAGAELRLGVAGPLRIAVADGVATGVVLGSGEHVAAERVVSDHDLRRTFTELVSARELDPEDNRAVRATRYRGTVARVALALDALPDFVGLESEALGGTLVVAPSIASLERAWDEAKRGRLPEQPHVELSLPTLRDPSLAPPGQHVLELWVQHVPLGFGDRAALLRRVLEALRPFSPALSSRVLHAEVWLPGDLERRFGLAEGQLYGGELRLDQAFFLRPFPGHAHQRTPIEGLFVCGSAAHPGGYSGRSGWNLAARLLSERA